MYMYVICKYIGPILVNFKPENRYNLRIHKKYTSYIIFSKIIKKNMKVALRAKRNETVIIIGGQYFLIRWLEIFGYFYQTLIGLLKFSTDDFYPLNTLHGM